MQKQWDAQGCTVCESWVTYRNATCAVWRPDQCLSKRRVLRIITFSNYSDHSNPLFKALEIIKFEGIVFLHNAILMNDFHSDTSAPAFSNYFTAVNKRHKYNTRLASRSSFVLPPMRTNYGKFSINKFEGAKIWNASSHRESELSLVGV